MSGRIALIGDPVAESVSPQMQNAAFRRAGIDLHYEAVRVTRDEFASAFPRLVRELRGMNVTIPLKEHAARAVDELGPEASEATSVNAIIIRDGRTTGRSTDGEGFMRALRRAGAAPRTALVLGAGGASRAVASALRREGVAVTVCDRATAASAAELSRDADLIVSAIPASAWRDAEPFPIFDGLRADTLVADLAYRPRRTPLLERASAAGAPVLEGVEMLIEQGALSFTLWTGTPAPVEVMREAAYAALAEPALR